ncbi:SH2 domain-containing protein 4A [Apus apus]|uniref:SH2 domain-containing protein 4A n=1 Tax=Apus apus TaxID=8895 RepID=UPI0021F8A7FA|nr:SH2 domain-containing protein 4A [Apus apus]XP_051476044.1 SH2 domain-containing protein 4A [Apus apus]XP_051476045.1 SH2 domain-containing protein 4A [Apus apus]
MLKQILSDMYIDPDLLAELSEEQKQILFFKMRQEQIRRWEEREAAEDKATAKRPLPRKASRKMVTWKLGADNDVWVWVMGEHPSDKPYEAICEEIQAQRAKQLVREQGKEDRENESSVTWPLHPQPGVLSEKNLQRNKKSTVEEKKEYGRNTAAATTGKNQELTKRETRDVHQMLADCHMRKHGFQQMKEAQRRNSEETTATQDAIPQNHPSLESQRTLQKSDENEPEWQESLRKSRAADEKRRSLAQQARDDYRRLSLQGIHRGKQADISKGATARDRRPLQYPPLPPKPKLLPPAMANGRVIRKEGIRRTISNSTEESIIKWFKDEQFPLRAGYQKTTDRIAPWFHGILTSKKAEELLNKTVPGSFLVRVSEKIKGYVLSYRSEEKCKHFLIDASSDSYSFLGVDQLQHATLADLVDYHKEEPITSLGKELLLYPCGQEDQEPDYICLFE